METSDSFYKLGKDTDVFHEKNREDSVFIQEEVHVKYFYLRENKSI